MTLIYIYTNFIFISYTNIMENQKYEEKWSLLSTLRNHTKQISFAIMLGLGSSTFTWCSKEDDQEIEIVTDSVKEEAEKYKKELNRLQAMYKKQDKEELLDDREKENIEGNFEKIQEYIKLKLDWREYVVDYIYYSERKTVEINTVIERLLNEVKSILTGEWYIIYTPKW